MMVAAPIIEPPSRAISRRSVLGSLLGLAAVVSSGSIALFAIEHSHSQATSSMPPSSAITVQEHSSTPNANKSFTHIGPEKEYTVSWSPDGTKIASAGNGELIGSRAYRGHPTASASHLRVMIRQCRYGKCHKLHISIFTK
jgi:hypothetical protein